MRLLVYGAGVLGSWLAARMHEAGHDVALLARGERLASLRRHGIQLAEGDSPFVVRRVPMRIGEPGAPGSPRSERIVRMFRSAGINARIEPRMDARLKTHAALAVPLGQAAAVAGGPAALADDPDAIRGMIRRMRQNLSTLPTPPVPRGAATVLALPDGMLVPVLQRFLRSPTAAHSGLSNTSPATEAAELERLAEQMRAP